MSCSRCRVFKTHCWYPHIPKGAKYGPRHLQMPCGGLTCSLPNAHKLPNGIVCLSLRYIVVVRNPADVAVSFFRFFQGWFFQPGEVGMDEFVRQFWLERGEPRSEMREFARIRCHHPVLFGGPLRGTLEAS